MVREVYWLDAQQLNVEVTINLIDRRYTYSGRIIDVAREFVEITELDGSTVCIAYNSIIVAAPLKKTKD